MIPGSSPGCSAAAPPRQGFAPSKQLIQIDPKKKALSSALYVGATLGRAANRFRREKPRRVFIFEPFGLGDMISFVPMVDELVRRGFETYVGSRPEWAELFPPNGGHHYVAARVPFSTHNEKAKYEVKAYFTSPFRTDFAQVRPLVEGATAYEPRGDVRCLLYLYALGCKRVVALSNYIGSDLLMWRSAAELLPFEHHLRRWELNLGFIKAVDPNGPPISVSRPLLSHLIDKKRCGRVGIMPIAPWSGKWWPKERWEQVASALEKAGLEVVAYCGPRQKEATSTLVGSRTRVVECGSVKSWAAEFNQCEFVISIDSGPMHLADALDVPVIALFGQGKLPLWAPSGPKSVVLTHQGDPDFKVCHPIEKNTPLGQDFMRRITVDEVLQAVAGLGCSV